MLDVIPIQIPIGKRVSPNLETFIRQSLQVPLSKFPFTGDLEREVDYGVKRLRPFSKNDDFKMRINEFYDPKAVALYWLHKGCLIRKHDATTSSLFLIARCKRSVKIASIYGAIYFTASVALPLLNGIMVHGVGINRRGVGLLFLGLSGAGKTTVAQLSDPAEVIADDGIILEHKEGDYFLATTPFDQLSSCSRRGIISPNYRSSLTMGLFLQKDNRVYLEKISSLEAGSLILKNQIHFFRYFPPHIAEKAFDLVTDLCRKIPFYRLYFKNDPSFWPLVEKELSQV